MTSSQCVQQEKEELVVVVVAMRFQVRAFFVETPLSPITGQAT